MVFNVNFTDEEYAVICGTLLGDAHLQRRNNSYRLSIAHSIDQKTYVEWKYKKLRRLCPTTAGPTIRIENDNFVVRFATSSSLMYSSVHSLFYQQKGLSPKGNLKYVKGITKQLIDNLPMNPLVLAVLYMDDGSVRNDCNAGRIATQGFSLPDTKLLCSYIEKWGVKAQPVVHTTNSGQYYITLPAKTFKKFTTIIKPIVSEIPEMMYKLGTNV